MEAFSPHSLQSSSPRIPSQGPFSSFLFFRSLVFSCSLFVFFCCCFIQAILTVLSVLSLCSLYKCLLASKLNSLQSLNGSFSSFLSPSCFPGFCFVVLPLLDSFLFYSFSFALNLFFFFFFLSSSSFSFLRFGFSFDLSSRSPSNKVIAKSEFHWLCFDFFSFLLLFPFFFFPFFLSSLLLLLLVALSEIKKVTCSCIAWSSQIDLVLGLKSRSNLQHLLHILFPFENFPSL